MDTTLLIVVAVVIVIALVAYSYRQKIGVNFKGWGVQARLQAEGKAEAATAQSGSRNVSIGGNATDARIVTGDDTPGKKSATGAGRNVSIGGSVEGSTVVTGDGNRSKN
jgi:uncharacterized protein (UPF0333 family)